jgi:hypothetical protein
VLGQGGLRLFHRTDVFRAREYTTRGHETHRECVPRSTGSGPTSGAAHCEDLSTGVDGRPLTAAELAAGVEPFLAAKQAVLHALHTSPAMAPVLYDVDPERILPLEAESTFDGLERYWAKYWAQCRGCLGLVWIEATYQGSHYCTRPAAPAVADGTFRVMLDLVSDRVPSSAIERERDGPLCGDRSWFQALWRGDNAVNFR